MVCLLPLGTRAHSCKIEILDPNTQAVQVFQSLIRATRNQSIASHAVTSFMKESKERLDVQIDEIQMQCFNGLSD